MWKELEHYLYSEHLIDIFFFFFTRNCLPLDLSLSLLKVLGAARGGNSHLFRKDCPALASKATAAWTTPNGNRDSPHMELFINLVGSYPNAACWRTKFLQSLRETPKSKISFIILNCSKLIDSWPIISVQHSLH